MSRCQNRDGSLPRRDDSACQPSQPDEGLNVYSEQQMNLPYRTFSEGREIDNNTRQLRSLYEQQTFRPPRNSNNRSFFNYTNTREGEFGPTRCRNNPIPTSQNKTNNCFHPCYQRSESMPYAYCQGNQFKAISLPYGNTGRSSEMHSLQNENAGKVINEGRGEYSSLRNDSASFISGTSSFLEAQEQFDQVLRRKKPTKFIRVKKAKLSGAQKKRRTRQLKLANGIWVEKPKIEGVKKQTPRMVQGTVPKTAKRDKPEDQTNREALMAVKMAVLIEGHPEKCLSEEQADDLELLITSKIEKDDKGSVPIFLSCSLENGALIINCADLRSSKWLEQTVSEINHWEEQKLLVGEARKLVKTTKIIANLPKICSKLNLKEIIKKIEAQNDGLTPTEWNISYVKDDPSGLNIVLCVPEMDAAMLGRRGYKFYIGLHQVQAKVLDQTPQNLDGGGGSSSEHPSQ